MAERHRDQRIAGKLVRAWLRGERLLFDQHTGDERSTDGESIFATYEIIATRAPVTAQPTILLNTRQYRPHWIKWRTARTVRRSLEILNVTIIACRPDYLSDYTDRDALLRTFYKRGLESESGGRRRPCEDWPERHDPDDRTREARVLPFRRDR